MSGGKEGKIKILLCLESIVPRNEVRAELKYHVDVVDTSSAGGKKDSKVVKIEKNPAGATIALKENFEIRLNSYRVLMTVSVPQFITATSNYYSKYDMSLKFRLNPPNVYHKITFNNAIGIWNWSYMWTEDSLTPPPDTKTEKVGLPGDFGAELSQKEIELLSSSSIDIIAKRSLPHNQVLTILKILGDVPHLSLKHINFYGSQICCAGAEILSQILHLLSNLTVLNLGHCNIGDPGVKVFSKSLVNSDCKLSDLDLSDNLFGDVGGVCLMESLATNTQLTRLDIRQNRIGDQVLLTLGLSLKSNRSLLTLRISGADSRSAITQKGLLELAKGLSLNSKLVALQVDLQPVFRLESSEEIKSQFLTFLSLNTSLTHVPMTLGALSDPKSKDKKEVKNEKRERNWECFICHSKYHISHKSCERCKIKKPKRQPNVKEKPAKHPILVILQRNFKRMILDIMYLSMQGTVPDVIVTMIMAYADITEETFTRKPDYAE